LSAPESVLSHLVDLFAIVLAIVGLSLAVAPWIAWPDFPLGIHLALTGAGAMVCGLACLSITSFDRWLGRQR
jgi:hypothetical protein